MFVVAACSDDAPDPPALSDAALQLHVCLNLEPDHEGPCTDAALRSCAPELSRDACLDRALDEIAAAEEFAEAPQQNDGPPTALVVLLASGGTAVFFLVVAWTITRREHQANEQAFTADLTELRRLGFEPLDPPASGLPPGLRVIGKPQHVLRRNGPPPVWLLETESRTRTLNRLGPARDAIIDVSGLLASAGPERVNHLVRELMAPEAAHIAAQLDGSLVAIKAASPVRVIRGARSPISLARLAAVAIRIADAIADDDNEA